MPGSETSSLVTTHSGPGWPSIAAGVRKGAEGLRRILRLTEQQAGLLAYPTEEGVAPAPGAGDWGHGYGKSD